MPPKLGFSTSRLEAGFFKDSTTFVSSNQKLDISVTFGVCLLFSTICAVHRKIVQIIWAIIAFSPTQMLTLN